MIRSKSIRADALVERVHKVAETAVLERAKALRIDPDRIEIGAWPDIGTVGIIIRDFDYRGVEAGALFEMADKITDGLDIVDGAVPRVDMLRDVITVGFFLSGPIELGRLR